MFPKLSLSFLLLFSLFIVGCDDDDNQPALDIPETYDFDNVDYDGQIQRLAQLQEMTNYLKTANTSGIRLDADRLKAMYTNTEGADFDRSYDDSKQLKNKTLSAVQADYETYLEAIAAASQSDSPASEGVAGVAVSDDGEKQYLLNERGLEWTQVIEKGLMGGCFYYQATSVYMGEERMNVDNQTIVPGEGTEMEHHWDEAFGYLGVPRAFPIDVDGAVFWGKYCNDRDGLLNTNEELMDALLKGRAAISASRLDIRDEAIGEARAAWEQVVAGTAIHYLNATVENFDDLARKMHALSEAVVFMTDLKFNPEKSLTNAEIDAMLVQLVGSADYLEMDLYSATVDNLMAVRDELATTFAMTEVASEL